MQGQVTWSCGWHCQPGWEATCSRCRAGLLFGRPGEAIGPPLPAAQPRSRLQQIQVLGQVTCTVLRT